VERKKEERTATQPLIRVIVLRYAATCSDEKDSQGEDCCASTGAGTRHVLPWKIGGGRHSTYESYEKTSPQL